MANVANGSLADSSLLRGTQRSFDVRNESDVIALLKAVHQNPIEPELKNILRDLIFNYRQSLADIDVQNLAQAFAPFGISILPSIQTQTKKAVTSSTPPLKSFGGPRLQPRFKPVAMATKKVEIPPAAIVEEKVIQKSESVPVSSISDRKAAAPSMPLPVTEYAERIKVIKRIVNEKVGNPVNLIETHNEIGREYMSALLDAMKKTSGVQGEGIAVSMERLEKAFEQVQEAISGVVSKSQPTSEQKVEPHVEAAPVKAALNKVVLPVAQAPIAPHVTSQKRTIPVTSVDDMSTANNDSPFRMASVSQKLQEKTLPETIVNATQQTPVIPAAPVFVEKDNMHSVAKEKMLQDLLRENRMNESQAKQEEEAARIATMDPILTPEVTAGLAQLLSEWGLFKSSGIFGTGPSGKEHPLYQKISGLTMAAVIAGRFEGATPHIKQNITDYMNGWRYEEGIIHEHAETFEHYLRKVIRHILDKQKRK